MRKLIAALVLCLSFSFTAQAGNGTTVEDVFNGWHGPYDDTAKFFITGLMAGMVHGIERFTSNMGYGLNEKELQCVAALLPGSLDDAQRLVTAVYQQTVRSGLDPDDFTYQDAYVYYLQAVCIPGTLQGKQESDGNVGS